MKIKISVYEDDDFLHEDIPLSKMVASNWDEAELWLANLRRHFESKMKAIDERLKRDKPSLTYKD